ncbi:NAD(P)/FAD-dependent oxidoreductase [Beduini massiliensis]|uniref:NAD(P)/FAD-dependent oxidoreductase n=1 Tax=Beduini massiliensis TaxID=1585974 RepID=UPI00059AA34E|nr:FAD-dependent oxidoreductase [Beduini massiliensis]
MNTYDLVIIGAGPAGMTAAIYGARADLKVLMLDKLAPGGQIINTNEIQNYTGMGTINGAELAMQMFIHTQELNVEFDYGTVTKIVNEENIKKIYIEEDSERIICTKAIIIATGTTPRRLNIPKEDQFIGNGISFCAICDGAYYRDKDVVVIGGGNSAVEESIYLAGIVKSLTIVTMFDLTADPIACDKLRALENVTVYPYQDVLEFVGDRQLEGVRFKSTQTGEEKTVHCDGVFEYIGLSPVTAFVKDLGILNDHGYIEVNDKMETKVTGIYGAGDCITKNLRQVITACADGAIAAQVVSRYVK